MAISDTALKQCLLANLESRGLVEEVYTDQVNNYLELRRIRRLLTKDINKNGVVIYDDKKGRMVDNPSINRRVQVSQQMISIFTALGFKDFATKAKTVGGEDFEL